MPNTSDSSNRVRQASASPHRFDNSEGNRLNLSQKSMGFSQIKDESPSFKLDSKRLIGRSRLFKYTDKEEEEEPPKFTFTPKKWCLNFLNYKICIFKMENTQFKHSLSLFLKIISFETFSVWNWCRFHSLCPQFSCLLIHQAYFYFSPSSLCSY